MKNETEHTDEAIALGINQVFEDLGITYLPSPNGDGESFDTQRPHRIEADCGVGHLLVTLQRLPEPLEWSERKQPPAPPRFTRTVVQSRTMTLDEVRQRAAEMQLSAAVTSFLVATFESCFDGTMPGEWVSEEPSPGRSDVSPWNIISPGTNGRVALGQSCDSVIDELAPLMGDASSEEIDRVFDAFFEE